jgi:hypothetical protein
MRIELPKFNTQKELFEHIVANKDSLIAQKRSLPIHSEPIIQSYEVSKESTTKALTGTLKQDELYVKVVMNTTNIMDSHSDVHVAGIWTKSLKENKTFYHLQEHRSDFSKVISDSAKAYVETIAWNQLGYSYLGTTDALIFESIVSKARNEEMYKQYLNRWVKNHSVGMQYIKMDVAINDNANEKEFDYWNKYIGLVANRKQAEEQGFFWVIQEAKLFEGSAVVFGSNGATPVLETIEPSEGTQKHTEPILITPKFSVIEALKKETNIIKI